MATIKDARIQKGSIFETRDIGADAQNIDVGTLSGSIVEAVVYGYKIGNNFYEQNDTTSTQILGEADKVYLDLNDNQAPYIYDITITTPAFVAVASGEFEFEKLSSILQTKAPKSTFKTATLSVGSTSVTFIGLPTTGTNVIDFFTNTGINYTAIDTSVSGQVTLTFDAQEAAVTVYCEIKEVS